MDVTGGGDPGGGSNASLMGPMDDDSILAAADAAVEGMDTGAGSPQLQIVDNQELESGEVTDNDSPVDDDDSRQHQVPFNVATFWDQLSSEEGRLAVQGLAENSPSFLNVLGDLLLAVKRPEADAVRQNLEVRDFSRYFNYCNDNNMAMVFTGIRHFKHSFF